MIVNPLFFPFVAKKAENHLFFNAVDFLSSFHFCPVHFPGVYEKGDQDCSMQFRNRQDSNFCSFNGNRSQVKTFFENTEKPEAKFEFEFLRFPFAIPST